MADRPLTLGAVLYEGFELLDMFGPLEMFTALPPEILQVVMVAESKGPVRAGSMANSPMPTCMADYGFDDAPELDLILVPGGVGTIAELENEKTLSFFAGPRRKSPDHIVGMLRLGVARKSWSS